MLIQIQFNSLCVTDKIIGMHSEHASVSNIILHLRYQLTVVRMPWITLLETYLCASRIWNRSRNCVMRRILRWLRHQSSNPATLLTIVVDFIVAPSIICHSICTLRCCVAIQMTLLTADDVASAEGDGWDFALLRYLFLCKISSN